MVTKGTYFAFVSGLNPDLRKDFSIDRQRAEMETGPLCKLVVQRVVGIHLDMYLPKPSPHSTTSEVENKTGPKPPTAVAKDEEEDKSEILRSIKEEDEEDEETLVDINEIKPKGEL